MRAVNGFFGNYGGQFSPETLIPALDELENVFEFSLGDETFRCELDNLMRTYAGRPTPVYFASNLSRKLGVDIYLKREDLLHTGAHKINNALGQALIARRLKKVRVIAETGAGQHGVATATAAALMGLECRVYMGRVDAERQKPNVRRMRLLGAEVCVIDEGQRTLKDAVSAAMRDWVTNVTSTHYIIGSALGPHPFPEMVASFQSVIGREAREYFDERGSRPDMVVACVGGGSNSIGIFSGFLDDPDVELVGVEAGGRGPGLGDNAATITCGSPGIFQGTYSYLIQNADGQVGDVHSVSAGLDYAGVGPQHSFLNDTGRARYVNVGDAEAVSAFRELSRTEGIIPALESSHALAWVMGNSGRLKGRAVLVNLSGRGDKDMDIVTGTEVDL